MTRRARGGGDKRGAVRRGGGHCRLAARLLRLLNHVAVPHLARVEGSLQGFDVRGVAELAGTHSLARCGEALRDVVLQGIVRSAEIPDDSVFLQGGKNNVVYRGEKYLVGQFFLSVSFNFSIAENDLSFHVFAKKSRTFKNDFKRRLVIFLTVRLTDRSKLHVSHKHYRETKND